MPTPQQLIHYNPFPAYGGAIAMSDYRYAVTQRFKRQQDDAARACARFWGVWDGSACQSRGVDPNIPQGGMQGLGDAASNSRLVNAAIAFGAGYILWGPLLGLDPLKSGIISVLTSSLGGVLERQTLHDYVKPNWSK